MYECESWTIKKTECQRINAFKLWCWRKLLRVPWTAKRSSQAILKEINPEYSLEGLRQKLKLQYFAPIMGRVNSLEKTLMLRKTEGRRRRRQQKGWDSWMSSPSQSTWVWANSRRQWRTGKPGMLQSMGVQKVGHNLGTKQYQCITLEIHFLKGISLMVFEGVTDFIRSLYYCDLLLETTTVDPLTVAVPEKWWCVLTLVV